MEWQNLLDVTLSFFSFLLIYTRFSLLAEIEWSAYISKSQRINCMELIFLDRFVYAPFVTVVKF